MLSGVTFGIYLDENCIEPACDSVIIENEPITVALLVGTYYVKVVGVPEKYVLSDNVYSVDIVEGNTVELVVDIAYITSNLTIAKVISGNGVDTYNFTASFDNGKTETFDVDAGGSYEIKDIVVGTGYTITENTVGADNIYIYLNDDQVAEFGGTKTVAEYSSTITEDDTSLRFVNNYRAYFPISISFGDDPLDRGAVSFTVNGEQYSVDENSSMELSFKEGTEVTIALNDTEDYSFTVDDDDIACTEYSTVISEPIYIYISAINVITVRVITSFNTSSGARHREDVYLNGTLIYELDSSATVEFLCCKNDEVKIDLFRTDYLDEINLLATLFVDGEYQLDSADEYHGPIFTYTQIITKDVEFKTSV